MATHSSILACRISMDRSAWWATVHGVAKSQTRLSTDRTAQPVNRMWLHLVIFWPRNTKEK